MSRSWQQEKEYRARRAEAVKKELAAAIWANDREAFKDAYENRAMQYLSARDRKYYYRSFLERRTKNEENNSI